MTAPLEHVVVHPAPPELRTWCLCAIVRRVHAGPLHSLVQANTWACLNTIVSGEVRGHDSVLPPRFVTGPFPSPFQTCVPESLVSISLVLQPWLLPSLTGRSAPDLAGRVTDVAQLGSGVLDLLCDASEDACDEGTLAPLWAAVAAQVASCRHGPPALALDALARHGVAAAAEALGLGARQYLRRFRGAMGLPPATWLRIRRWEAAVGSLAGPEPTSLAELSLRHGFSDQAHLARDTRAIADASPARLRQLLRDKAGHWSLQPAHVRLIQDSDDARP
ncbi:MAG: AraC family transcriptional regulator [Ramlibacter sp.]|jgi:AraC-like DNA-binding protein|nr:AraC family transcriptional regulator [Ramlibacter sp.]MDF2464389.1 AraC family transcriptional regulator [Ramlibacter sp.]